LDAPPSPVRRPPNAGPRTRVLPAPRAARRLQDPRQEGAVANL
jgi:hypothetical protein